MKPPLHAKRLRALLRQANWRDEQLAVEAAVSARTISDIRRGCTRSVRPATARCIAAAFSAELKRPVTPEYIAGDPTAEH